MSEPPIGGQEDEHGCRPGAGETWSVLRKSCVRVFDVADLRLTDPKATGQRVYVILSQDRRQAEVFAAALAKGTVLRQTPAGYASSNGEVQLNRAGSRWTIRY